MVVLVPMVAVVVVLAVVASNDGIGAGVGAGASGGNCGGGGGGKPWWQEMVVVVLVMVLVVMVMVAAVVVVNPWQFTNVARLRDGRRKVFCINLRHSPLAPPLNVVVGIIMHWSDVCFHAPLCTRLPSNFEAGECEGVNG